MKKFADKMRDAIHERDKAAYIIYLVEEDEWFFSFDFDEVEVANDEHESVLFSYVRVCDAKDIENIMDMIIARS